VLNFDQAAERNQGKQGVHEEKLSSKYRGVTVDSRALQDAAVVVEAAAVELAQFEEAPKYHFFCETQCGFSGSF
jgi:hypothetical protein